MYLHVATADGSDRFRRYLSWRDKLIAKEFKITNKKLINYPKTGVMDLAGISYKLISTAMANEIASCVLTT